LSHPKLNLQESNQQLAGIKNINKLREEIANGGLAPPLEYRHTYLRGRRRFLVTQPATFRADFSTLSILSDESQRSFLESTPLDPRRGARIFMRTAGW